MKLAICGYTASGKSYQAKLLAREFGLEYISGSSILLKVANVSSSEIHFWIKNPGIDLCTRRFHNHKIDIHTDKEILRLAEIKNNVIFDSWSLPWLYSDKDLCKIYLAASLDTRAKIAYGSREEKPFTLEEIKTRIRKKDSNTRKIFLKIHGFDISDYSKFDIVIDNSELHPEETSKRLISAVSGLHFPRSG